MKQKYKHRVSIMGYTHPVIDKFYEKWGRNYLDRKEEPDNTGAMSREGLLRLLNKDKK